MIFAIEKEQIENSPKRASSLSLLKWLSEVENNNRKLCGLNLHPAGGVTVGTNLQHCSRACQYIQ